MFTLMPPAAKKRTLEEPDDLLSNDDYAYLKDLVKKIKELIEEAEDDNDLGKKVRQLIGEYNEEKEDDIENLESDEGDVDEDESMESDEGELDEEAVQAYMKWREEQKIKRGPKRIQLISNDGVTCEVDEDVACKSGLMKQMLEFSYDSDECSFPLSTIDGRMLKKILEYCHQYRHVEHKPNGKNEEIQLTDWDKTFLMNIRDDDLPHLLVAAEFLDIRGLVEIILQKITDMDKGKTVKGAS